MRKLSCFIQVSLDGYFADLNGDMSWAKKDDEEFCQFVEDNAKGGEMLLFGRITYEMMASFWPTPLAAQIAPVVAERMNNLPKVVFSRTLEQPLWNNTTLIKDDITAAVQKMKNEPGEHMAILGSGSIVSQLTEAGLIDEYQYVINPILLGQGKPMFAGITARLNLKLTKTRIFGNGNVLLCYEPAR